MKRYVFVRFFYMLFSASMLLNMISFPAKSQAPDQKMVQKYGLKVPSDPPEVPEPAPEWLRKADMFTSSKRVWKGHEFTLKDTLMTRIVRVRAENSPRPLTENYPVETILAFDGSPIKGVSLISHVPHSKKAFDEAHKQGFRVIPYVHFTDIHTLFADQDVFMFQHPEILLKDDRGKWMHIPMDGSDRAFRFLTCVNSPSYWKMSLAYVKKMMDWGADGIFIDNVGKRQPCFATKFDKVNNPEFAPYVHEHLFPDASQDYAWDKLLQAMRGLVKSYGDDKVIVLNSGIGTPFQKDGDCCMWESFIYSWAWEGRNHTWADVKKRAADNSWFLKTGRRITALSTINPSRKEAREDAFWAFSAARLVDFIWWADLNGSGAESLYKAHMGKDMGAFVETGGVAFRFFENGMIILNDNDSAKDMEVPVPAEFRARRLTDLYHSPQLVQVRNKKIRVTIPAKSARIYLAPEQI